MVGIDLFDRRDFYENRYPQSTRHRRGGALARKAQRLRQDDAAGSIGVSESFLGKIESGAESVQWGKLFQVLEGLGVRLTVDIPDEAGELFAGEAIKRYGREQRRRAREDNNES